METFSIWTKEERTFISFDQKKEDKDEKQLDWRKIMEAREHIVNDSQLCIVYSVLKKRQRPMQSRPFILCFIHFINGEEKTEQSIKVETRNGIKRFLFLKLMRCHQQNRDEGSEISFTQAAEVEEKIPSFFLFRGLSE